MSNDIKITIDPNDNDNYRAAVDHVIDIKSPVGDGRLGLRIEDGRLTIEAYHFDGNIRIEAMAKDLNEGTVWRGWREREHQSG